jgi:hypothetical protein
VHAPKPSTPTGCVGSLIPDVKPCIRFATLGYRDPKLETRLTDFETKSAAQYDLLIETIRGTIRSCGRFPAFIRYGDVIGGLIDEGVSLGRQLLRLQITSAERSFLEYVWDDAAQMSEVLISVMPSDAFVVSGAKSIARHLVHREKIETRWFETDGMGRRVRRSRAVLRIAHPVKRHNEEGELEWSDPADDLTVDADGSVVAHGNLNEVEERMVARLDRLRLRLRVISAVGSENYRWMTEYVERKHSGVPIPPADRDRFRNLKNKVRSLSHETA